MKSENKSSDNCTKYQYTCLQVQYKSNPWLHTNITSLQRYHEIRETLLLFSLKNLQKWTENKSTNNTYYESIYNRSKTASLQMIRTQSISQWNWFVACHNCSYKTLKSTSLSETHVSNSKTGGRFGKQKEGSEFRENLGTQSHWDS